MSRITSAFILSVLAVSAMPAQQPAKSSATTSTKAAPASAKTQQSNQDLNLQAYVELLRSDINKGKVQIVTAVMQLDSAQSAAFWPIYHDFQAEMNQVGDQIASLVTTYIKNYDNMTGDLADQMANKLLDIEQKRNEVKRKYYPKFKAALDPIVATEFLQVENQIEKLLDLQIASQLPVMSSGGR
jgi:hypothetical protein